MRALFYIIIVYKLRDSLTHFQITCEDKKNDNKRKTVNRKRYSNFYFPDILQSVVI